MTGSLPLNLILSLVFGVGQIIVGAWLAWHSLAHGRYRLWRMGMMAFVGVWFVVSGVVELFVSGMETSQRLSGTPSALVFLLWRWRADTMLFTLSALLAGGALVYALVAWRWHVAAGASAGKSEMEGERIR